MYNNKPGIDHLHNPTLPPHAGAMAPPVIPGYGYYPSYPMHNGVQSVPLAANGMQMAANSMAMQNPMQMYQQAHNPFDPSGQWGGYGQAYQTGYVPPQAMMPMYPPQHDHLAHNMHPQLNHDPMSAPSTMQPPLMPTNQMPGIDPSPPQSPRIRTVRSSSMDSTDTKKVTAIKVEPSTVKQESPEPAKKEKKRYLKTEKWQKNLNYLR